MTGWPCLSTSDRPPLRSTSLFTLVLALIAIPPLTQLLTHCSPTTPRSSSIIPCGSDRRRRLVLPACSHVGNVLIPCFGAPSDPSQPLASLLLLFPVFLLFPPCLLISLSVSFSCVIYKFSLVQHRLHTSPFH